MNKLPIKDLIRLFEITPPQSLSEKFDTDTLIRIIEHYNSVENYRKAIFAGNIGYDYSKGNLDFILSYAEAFWENGDMEECIEILEDSYFLATYDARLNFYLGRAHYFITSEEDALNFLNKAVLNSENSTFEHYYYLGWKFLIENSRQKAINSFFKAIKINPDNICIINELTDISSYSEAKQENVIKFLKTFIDKSPFNARYWLNLGLAYQNFFSMDEAFEAFGMAVAIEPGNPYFQQKIAEAYESDQDITNALEHYENCLTTGWDYNSNIPFQMALICIEDENFNKARQYLMNCIHQSPYDGDYWYCMAITYQHQSNSTKALAYIQEAVKLDPDNPEFWHSLAKIQSELGSEYAAEKSFGKSLELDPLNNHVWIDYAMHYRKIKNIEKAIDLLYEAIIYTENNGDIYFILAGILLENGQNEKGRRCLEKAYLENPYWINSFFSYFPKLNSNSIVQDVVDKYSHLD